MVPLIAGVAGLVLLALLAVLVLLAAANLPRLVAVVPTRDLATAIRRVLPLAACAGIASLLAGLELPAWSLGRLP